MRPISWLAVALLLSACGDSTPPEVTAPDAAQIALRRDGWLRGDLHMHTLWSDGFESVAEVIALAEYLENPTFLTFNPDYRDNGLDFIAVTDHRTADVIHDPEYESDRLVLLTGEEFGSTGHANVWGISELVQHDPDGDGTTLSDIENAIAHTHAQGALFSPNHLFLPRISWPWEVRNIDAMEIWNSGWAMASPATSADDLAEWEAAHGPASPLFERGVQVQGRGGSGQSLVYYEALLSRGIHVALVGGSDRHAVVLPGFPTTYVQAPTPDVQGVLAGIEARHTFVTRTPASVQLIGTLSASNGATYAFGDAVPVPASGADVTLEIRVARGRGGRLQVIRGGRLECDEALARTEPLGAPLFTAEIADRDQRFEIGWRAAPGDWVYALVREPLVAEGTDPELDAAVRAKAAGMIAGGGDVEQMIPLLIDLLDDSLGDPERFCDSEQWDPARPQCVLADTEVPGSYFIPDVWDRATNAWIEEGGATDWCMGAIASAILFVEAS